MGQFLWASSHDLRMPKWSFHNRSSQVIIVKVSVSVGMSYKKKSPQLIGHLCINLDDFCVHLACSNHIHNSKRMWDSREIAVDQIHFSIVAHDGRRRNFAPHSIDNFGKYPERYSVPCYFAPQIFRRQIHVMTVIVLTFLPHAFCWVLHTRDYYATVAKLMISAIFASELLSSFGGIKDEAQRWKSSWCEATMYTCARNLSMKTCNRWVCSTDAHQVSVAYSSAGFKFKLIIQILEYPLIWLFPHTSHDL